MLTRENFDRLLAWLHPEREQAGKVYEEIRSVLMKVFRSHDCPVPEELADETINRVAKKLPEIVETYVGDPARYFYRVAHYVHLEYLRRQPETTTLSEDLPLPPESDEDIEVEYDCLEGCVRQLNPRNRELVLHYYQGEKGVKIERRRELARRLNIELPVLRLQAHRIRTGLKKCMRECLRQKAA